MKILEDCMIELRQERPEDYFETENVIREAFWNRYTPACNDHYLIHVMRECGTFVPELDLVAVDGEKIVGNSMCLKSYIDGDDGRRYEVLSLGPIGVLPEYQKKGIGGMLLAKTKEIAKRMGFQGILLCGDPDYYTNQGFVPAERYEIRNAENMYADALHACELCERAFAEVKGCYFEDEIYNVDDVLVREYDKLFPQKEVVCGNAMQKKFEMMVERVRPYTGVIFDFNGTMFYDEEFQTNSWRTFVESKVKRNISDQEVQEYIHGRNAEVALEHFLGRMFSEEEIETLEEEKEVIYRKLCLASPDFKLANGLPEFLDELISRKIPITIATASGWNNVKFFFEHLGLDKWFDINTIVYNDRTLAGKPAPDLYLKAAERFGVDIKDCVVFEDSKSGIESAKRACAKKIIRVASVPEHEADDFGVEDVIKDYTEKE